MEMKFPVYVHGMLKTESWSGAIRPDKTSAQISVRVPEHERRTDQRVAARTALFAHVGRRWSLRRPALPTWSIIPTARPIETLYRFSADRHHPKDPARHEARSEGHSGKTDQLERAGNRRRRRACQTVETLRPKSGLRPGRSYANGQTGRAAAADPDAAFRRRLGLVLRLGRAFYATHDGLYCPWAATRCKVRRGPRARSDGARRSPG